MMLSMAVLSFLILAANLGVLDAVSHDTQAKKSIHKTTLQPNTYCCFAYHKSQIIQCNNMEDYFETSSECSLPAVVFRTKNRQWLCTNPAISQVQDCVIKLKNQANKKSFSRLLLDADLKVYPGTSKYFPRKIQPPMKIFNLPGHQNIFLRMRSSHLWEGVTLPGLAKYFPRTKQPPMKIFNLPGPRDNFFSITSTPKPEVTLPDAETKKPIIYYSPTYSAVCCFFYTERSIQCSNVKDYFKTSGKCLQPAVIFLTREGRLVCTNPKDPKVQDCVTLKNQRNTVVSG